MFTNKVDDAKVDTVKSTMELLIGDAIDVNVAESVAENVISGGRSGAIQGVLTEDNVMNSLKFAGDTFEMNIRKMNGGENT